MIAQVVMICLISVVASRPSHTIPEYSSQHYQPEVYDEKPQPYTFGFNTQDEHGATINQHESGDDFGNKKGSYGYTDGYGIYRQVDYVADEHGFRATIKTNEPGTDNQNSADIEVLSEAAPVAHEGTVGVYAHQPAVAPVYNEPAIPLAPAYPQPAAAVHGPVTYGSAPVYDSAHAPVPVTYSSAPVQAPAEVHGPATYGSAPVYDSVHAPAEVYSSAYEASPAGHASSYDSAPVYGHGPVAAHVPVYESIGAPVYGGPSYDQLLDKANQVNGHSSEYEPHPVDSYDSY